MLTPFTYGNAAAYLGPLPSGATAPWAFLASTTLTSVGSNLPTRKTNMYGGWNLPFNTLRRTVVSNFFFGITGPRRAVFPAQPDWSIRSPVP